MALLNEAPLGWKRGRLKNLVHSCMNGVWGDEPESEGAGTPTVRVADFDWEHLIVSPQVPTRRLVDPRQLRRVQLSSGDLVLEKSGGGDNQPVGRAVRFTGIGPAVCSNFTARVRPAAGTDSRYLCYSLAAAYWARLNTKSTKQTTGIQNLDSNAYLREAWVIPDLRNQRLIADFLDRETQRIDTLVDAKQRMIDLLKEKRLAYVSHAVAYGIGDDSPLKPTANSLVPAIPVHWELGELKRIVTRIGSGMTPRGGSERYVSDGVTFIRSQNVRFEGLSLEDAVYIDAQTDAEMAHTRLRLGDVLLNITGASLGRVCTFDLSISANVNQHVAIVRPRRDVDPAWLALALGSSQLQDQIWASQSGSAREGLSAEVAGRLVLAVPPLAEQKRISAHVADRTAVFRKVLRTFERQLALLAEYRQALITNAVTGQLDEATLKGDKPADEVVGA